MSEITIYIRRNTDLVRVGQLDDYQSLNYVGKYNDVGKWTLQLPGDHALADDLGTTGGIIVEDEYGTIFSGVIDDIEEQDNGEEYKLTISGSDDSAFLDHRIIYPSAFPFTSSAYDTRTGVVSTVLRLYANAQLGSTAVAERRVSGFTLGTDPVFGSSVTGKARLQKLLILLQELALAGGDVGFRIIQVGSSLEFQTYEPEDKTDSIQFSKDLGNLSGFTYKKSVPKVNHLVVGGQGEGTARTFKEGSDSQAIIDWNRRIEEFRDRRDTNVTAELIQTVAEELAANSEETSLALEPVDTDAVTYNRDYGLGDKVTVVTRSGVEIQDIVREVSITWTPEQGRVITPVVGSPEVTHPNIPRIHKKFKYVEQKEKDLERI